MYYEQIDFKFLWFLKKTKDIAKPNVVKRRQKTKADINLGNLDDIMLSQRSQTQKAL